MKRFLIGLIAAGLLATGASIARHDGPLTPVNPDISITIPGSRNWIAPPVVVARTADPDRHNATRETGDRHTPYGQVADGDNTLGDSRTHRDRINTQANMNQRPAPDRDIRSVLESQNRARLEARAADQPRRVPADTLAADTFLAHGTEPKRR